MATPGSKAKLPPDWSADTIFIETDVRGDALARHLTGLGFHHYLGVSKRKRTVARLQERNSATCARFAHTDNPRIVLHNNAEVLILSGNSALALWKYRQVRHARYVGCRLSLHPICIVALIGWLLRFVAGQFRKPSLLRYFTPGGHAHTYLFSRVARPKNCYHDALHFIPHGLGLKGLFQQLQQQRSDYAVLRWFEELPEREPTGDIDLLVADDSLEDVLRLMQTGPAIRPCDIYTPSGLPQSRYMKLSYYPPELARQILANAKSHRGFCQVPNARDYFHSLAYHAVYHKGPQSNLPGSERYRPRGRRSTRDFAAILGDMANRLGIDAEISLTGLHDYLRQQQWSPPPDLIVRLAAAAPRNGWLAELAATAQGDPKIDPGLVVFVIRDSAIEAGIDDKIVSLIQQQGFILLANKQLTGAEIKHGVPRTRGGNWGPGPKDHLGGLPAILLVAYDPAPLRPTRSQRKRFPLVTNARTLCKEQIRRQMNDAIAPRPPINGIHSSDNGAEAHHFLHIFAPELVGTISDEITALRGRATQRRRAA